ncbi:MAG: ATP synthase subunit I [Pyrinomonadaceae bacterium]
MSENSESDVNSREMIKQLSHRRILFVMGMIVILGSIFCSLYVSRLFGLGFFLGGILSFINYYWLKATLKRVFEEASEGERPAVSAGRYVGRYLAIGAIIGFVFLTRTVPVASVILGLTSFALAVLVEALIRIFLIVFNRKEI